MIDTFKELLNSLCEEFGTDNEVVIKISQHLDKLIVEEQRNIFKNLER